MKLDSSDRENRGGADPGAREAAILAAALDCVIGIDHRGRVIEFNPAAERTFGYTRAEALGRQMADLIIPPSLRERHRQGLAQYLISGGGPVIGRRIEMMAMRSDGSEFPVELAITHLPGSDPPEFVGYVHDITARRGAQDRLLKREKDERFLSEASVLLDASFEYEQTLRNLADHAVPYLADWCGVDMWSDAGSLRPLAIAHRDSALVSNAWEVRIRYLDMPIPQAFRVGRSELIADLADDPSQHLADGVDQAMLRELGLRSVMVVPLLVRGEPIGMLTFGMAESGRRYGSGDLRLAENLAGRAGVAIDHARLYREAKEAVRVRDEFLATASHDLRSPLSAIKGNAQLLMRRVARIDSSETQKVLQGLASIDASTTKMAGMIRELLDVARLQAGQPLDLELAEHDLVEIVMSVANEFQAGVRKHRLVVQAAQSEVTGTWDRLRLERVLANLISNAIKYSPEGGDVTIGVNVLDVDGKPRAVVKVSDAGLGIPASDLPRVFERFHRAGNVAGQIPGMGVGLASARQIVRQHGGEIAIDSAEGVGTTVSVRLPLVATEATEAIAGDRVA